MEENEILYIQKIKCFRCGSTIKIIYELGIDGMEVWVDGGYIIDEYDNLIMCDCGCRFENMIDFF